MEGLRISLDVDEQEIQNDKQFEGVYFDIRTDKIYGDKSKLALMKLKSLHIQPTISFS